METFLKYAPAVWAWLVSAPWVLMIAGAIIFATGAYYTIKPVGPTAEVPAPNSSASPGMRPIPASLRGDYEKLLGDLSNVINRKVRPVYEQTERIAQSIVGPSMAPDLADVRDKLRAVSPILEEAFNEIYRQMIPNNDLFSERLRYILNFERPETSPIYVLNQKASTVQGDIYEILSVVAKSEGKVSTNEMFGLFRTDVQNLHDASEATKKWVAQCNERIRQE